MSTSPTTQPRPAPYPADTKAKGWRFELDLEQVQQSDTWALAAEVPMAQHALLMMWATAWQQVPCGAMPADRALIRAKLKIPPKLWAPMADVVLRGWWLADDGRMYHNTIVSRVQSMLGAKEEARQRKADYRARKDSERQAQQSQGVQQLSHGTDEGQQQDGRGKDNTGTGTGTINTPAPAPAREAAASCEVFPIAEGWHPSAAFATQAKLLGLPVLDQQTMAEGIAEFTAFWMSRPKEIRTQAEWENALAKSLKRTQVKAAGRPGSPARSTGNVNRQEALEIRNRAAVAAALAEDGKT